MTFSLFFEQADAAEHITRVPGGNEL